jgi:glycosyl transferase family 25
VALVFDPHPGNPNLIRHPGSAHGKSMITPTLETDARVNDATVRPVDVGPAGMDILVINLDRSPERLAFMATQLDRLGLVYTKLPAVDGAAIPVEEFDRLSRTYMRPLSRSELGCMLSHASAWRHCVETGRPALVLEDDAFLSDRLPAFLSELGRKGTQHIVNLETQGSRKWVSREPLAWQADCGVALYRLYIDRGGAAGYVIWPDAARKLLERSRSYAAPADAFVDLSGIARFQAEPGLVASVYRAEGGNLRVAPAFDSTNTKPSRAFRRSLVLHPWFKMRRLAGYIAKTTRKIRTIGIGTRRRIDICSTICARADDWRN